MEARSIDPRRGGETLMTWNPAQYLQYEDARLRPALDLLARVPLERPSTVVDLGCGAGNVAQRLAQRWPDARIVGVDADAAMLDKARAATQGASAFTWIRADIGAWRAQAPVDLIFSNAALHWLDGHAQLFPSLAQQVAHDGVLAVQMPANFDAPSHAILREVARSPRWRDAVGDRVLVDPVHAPARYLEWLAPHATSTDLWTTEYLQQLPARGDGEHPVVAWIRGSALVPILGALNAAEREAFVADYASRVADTYVVRTDGSVLFPFRRLFVIARR
jgi:trans-aconitate 2-methyltransferase